jgi:methionyl-tRNA formyltransferase
MKIVFFGTPEFAVPCLQQLLNHADFQAVGVVTQPDKRRGRGSKATPSPIKSLALQHQLPLWQPDRIKKDLPTLQDLANTQADVFVVVAYGQILSEKILAMPRLGCINVHGSLLPTYRGAAPIQRCLCNGDAETGITTMLMDKGMDTGPMLLKASLPIDLLENADTLARKLSVLGADLLIATLLEWEKQAISAISQDSSLATYAPLIDKSEYEIAWVKPAIAIHNQIRGLFPHCQTLFRDAPLKILATLPLDKTLARQLPEPFANLVQNWQFPAQALESPGAILGVIKGQGPVVQTGEGALLLTQVQPTGKRSQSGWDFVNGMRVQLAEILG